MVPRLRLLLIWVAVVGAFAMIGRDGTVVPVRAQSSPEPPPTVTGKVRGDGSKAPMGLNFRFPPIPSESDPNYTPHPTVFNVVPATIPSAYPLGIDTVPEDVSPNFNGTTGKSDEPKRFDIYATTPGKRVTQNGNPAGIYTVNPYFVADQKIACPTPACSVPIDVTLHARWGTVRGQVTLKDGTPIPRTLGVAAAPTYYPSPAPDNRWKVHTTNTRAEGEYIFTASALVSESASDLCRFPFTNFCYSIPIDQDNNWALPVLGDGGLDDREKHYYSNGPGKFTYKVFLSDKYQDEVEVRSSTASVVNFMIDPQDLQDVEEYQQENRPFDDDSPEGEEEEEEDCEEEGGGPLVGGGPAAGTHPVSLITGNVFLDQEDVRLPGVRRDLVFSRGYNSFSRGSRRFGWGWNHTFDKSIETMSTQVLRLWGSEGTPMYFTDPDRDGVFRTYGAPDGPSWITSSVTGFLRTFRTGGYEQYDTQGRLTERADRTGRAVALSYDGSGRLTDIVSPEGRRLRLEYDGPGGHVSRLLGPAGLIASYFYAWGGPAFGGGGGYQLRQVTYADGSGFRFTYDDTHRLKTVADIAGVTLDNHGYDSEGRAAWSELNAGRERLTYTYEDGRTLVTNARGALSTFEYTQKTAGRFVTRVTGCGFCGTSVGTRTWDLDDQGRVTRYVSSDNHPTAYRWEGNNLVGITNALGHETTYSGFDQFGRPGSMTVPGRGTTTLTYAAEGVTSVSLATGHTTTMTFQNHRLTAINTAGLTSLFDFNDLGDLRSTTDARGKTTTFSYDGMGRVMSMTTADNQTTRMERTAGGRVSAVLRPDGKRIEINYDSSGRLAGLKDESNRRYGRTYDPYDRLMSVSDPLGSTRFEYDLMSNLTAVVDPLHRRTTFGYDVFGRVESVTDPADASETYEYYPSGLLRVHTDRRGISRTFEYDAVGRPTSLIYSDGTPALTVTHNDLTRTETLSNGTDTLTRTYDHIGRLLSEASALNSSLVTYSYDSRHQREWLRLNGALVANYAYTDGVLRSITSGGQQLQFDYDDLGRRRTLTFPNGLRTTYDYDPQLGWLTRMATSSGAATAWDISYSHDAIGNRLSRAMAGDTEQYQYDEGSRLVRTDRVGGTPRTWTWSFDAVGNRTQEAMDGSPRTMTYDVRNRLLTATGGGLVRVQGRTNEASTVTVDGHPARMLPDNAFEADVPRAPGQTTFMVEARDASGNVRTSTYRVDVAADGSTFSYDGNGNLISKTGSTGNWVYEWNGAGELTRVLRDGAEVVRYTYDPLGRRVRKVAAGIAYSFIYDGTDIVREIRSDGTQFTFIHGPGVDEPLMRSTTSGDSTYYHADGVGSIVKTTDPSGNVTLVRQYDPWGNLEEGAATPGYAYTGREWDPEAGLYYYRARYFDPQWGRFISEDPIGFDAGVNFYAYVSGNPVNWRDPFGLKEGSAQNKAKRARIAQIATDYMGSTDWKKNVRKDEFPAGTYKCNKFVCDVTSEAGAPLKLRPGGRCTRAGENADPNRGLDNWRVLGPGEAAEPGDVAAYSIAGGGTAYSGHTGVQTDQGVVAARESGVALPGAGQFGPGTVYRRYTGN